MFERCGVIPYLYIKKESSIYLQQSWQSRNHMLDFRFCLLISHAVERHDINQTSQEEDTYTTVSYHLLNIHILPRDCALSINKPDMSW